MIRNEIDEFRDCEVKDLYFGPLTKDDEELIVNANKVSKMQSVVVWGFLILMIYVAVMPWFSNQADLKGKLIISSIGVVFAVLIYIFAIPRGIKPVGVIRGRVVSCHHETHRSANHNRVYTTYYAQVEFDTIKRRVRSMEVPHIVEKVSNAACESRAPETGTEIAIYKIKEGRYSIIYPQFYDRQS